MPCAPIGTGRSPLGRRGTPGRRRWNRRRPIRRLSDRWPRRTTCAPGTTRPIRNRAAAGRRPRFPTIPASRAQPGDRPPFEHRPGGAARARRRGRHHRRTAADAGLTGGVAAGAATIAPMTTTEERASRLWPGPARHADRRPADLRGAAARRPQPRACRSRRCATTSRRPACTTCSSTSTSRRSTRRPGGCALDGLVDRPLELTLDDLRARPRRTVPGDARVRRQRPGPAPAAAAEQPVAARGDRHGGVDAARRSGRSSTRPGCAPTRAELVFTGADRGVQGGVEHDYQRSLRIAEARRPEVLLVDEMNGAAAPAAARLPAAPPRARLVRHDEREVAAPDRGRRRAVRRLPAGARPTTIKADADDPGDPGLADPRARAHDAARHPRLLHPPPARRRRAGDAPRPGLGRAARRSGASRSASTAPGRDATLEPALGEFAWRGWSFDWDAEPGEHALACRATDADGDVQPLDIAVELPGHGQQRRPVDRRNGPRGQLSRAQGGAEQVRERTGRA